VATVKTTRFELAGADGRPVRGEVRTAGSGAGRPAVVICHGFKGFKDWGFFPHLAARLARAGISAVSFNFSSSGIGPDGESFSEPERFARATISGDLDDLTRVSEALGAGQLAQGIVAPAGMGLFGHSRGGGVAVLRAAADPSCRCLATWAAISTTMRWDAATVARWRRDGRLDIVNTRTGQVLPVYTDFLDDLETNHDRLDVLAAAARVSVPWMVVHGDTDESVPVVEARRLSEAAGARMTSLLIIAGGGHAFGARHPWSGTTTALDQAMEATVDWFTRHLL
jgi:dienelactone hydrolase